jgi:pantetheine-phosphate adenylyltransferase
MSGIAYYGISGDPLTYGHMHVISKARAMFDSLIVGLAVNPDKNYTFPVEDRAYMIRKAVSEGMNVVEIPPDRFLVREAKRAGAGFLVRGIRNVTDFHFEMELSHLNSSLERTIQTVWVPTPPDMAIVSSSLVKKTVGLEGWEKFLEDKVPPVVIEYLKEWHERRSSQ